MAKRMGSRTQSGYSGLWAVEFSDPPTYKQDHPFFYIFRHHQSLHHQLASYWGSRRGGTVRVVAGLWAWEGRMGSWVPLEARVDEGLSWTTPLDPRSRTASMSL